MTPAVTPALAYAVALARRDAALLEKHRRLCRQVQCTGAAARARAIHGALVAIAREAASGRRQLDLPRRHAS